MTLAATATLTAIALGLLGTHPVIAAAGALTGLVVGALLSFGLIAVAMGFSAEEAGYGRAMGLSDRDEPSRRYELVGLAVWLVPVPATVAATLVSALMLSGLEVTTVATGVLVATGLLGAFVLWQAIGEARSAARERRDAAEAAKQWLLDRHASAMEDPEFAAALAAEGWQPDGPYEAMRAAYFRAWERVKSARRADGRPVFGRADRPRGQGAS